MNTLVVSLTATFQRELYIFLTQQSVFVVHLDLGNIFTILQIKR